MTYSLRGVVGIHARLEPGTFLVPYFVSKVSNHTFAQELGTDRRVKAFKPIEVGRFALSEIVPHAIELDVGDPGLIAFANSQGEVIVDFALELKATLKASDFGNAISAFRRIDICYFLHDFKGLEKAINDAAKTLHPQVRQSWKTMERAAAKRFRVSSRKAVDVDTVRKSFEGEQGYDLWIEAWRSLGPTEWLLVDGFKLAFETDGDVAQRIRIASYVLFTLQSKRISARLRETILLEFRAWLGGAAIHDDTLMWSKAWLAASKIDNLIDYRSMQHGIDYLKTTPLNQQPRASWNKIWKAIWVHPDRSTDELIDLAGSVLGRFGTTSHGRRFVALLSEMIEHPVIESMVREWVTASESTSSQWITAYLAMLRSGRSDTEGFVDIGLNWLRNDAGNLKKWAEVYEEVSRFRDETVMLPIALDWVLRSNMQMRIWPKIAAKVLSSSDDHRLQDLVRQWVEAHPTLEESWELQLLLDDPGSPVGGSSATSPWPHHRL